MKGFSVRRKYVRSQRTGWDLRHNTLLATFLLLVFLLLFYRYFLSEAALRPKGCNVVQIWSHRGHLDSSAPENRKWTCDHVLKELQTNGIRHFDVDVLFYNGQSMVAHPTEMGNSLGDFSPSPCSKLPLAILIQKLKSYYGPEGFFLTIEPKSEWSNVRENGFLAPPSDVVSGILDVLEENPIPNQQCGIILQPWQLQDSRVAPLEYRIHKHCLIATPLRLSDAPLSEMNFPADIFKLSMPTIELFGNADGDWFLKEAQRHRLPVVLWVVDTADAMRTSLQMRGVHGIISNNPIRLKHMYEKICGGEYAVRGAMA
jgi:hypothetical protein